MRAVVGEEVLASVFVITSKDIFGLGSRGKGRDRYGAKELH